MALDYLQHFVSDQYLKNKSMELDQILPFTRSSLDYYAYISANSQHSNGPWLFSKFRFAQRLENKLMEFDQILHMHCPKPLLG